MNLDHAAGEELLERYGRAWMAFDGDAWTDLFTEDVEYREDPFEPAIVGHNAVRAYLLEESERQQDVEFTVERHWVADPTVLAVWHASYVQRTDLARVRLAGFLTMEVADDGRIARFREWWHRRETPRARVAGGGCMAGDVSFDVVSDFDEQELRNALDQVRREVGQRYDFKGVTVDLTQAKDELVLVTDDEYRAAAVKDLIESKAIRRNLSLKIFDWGKVEPAGGNKVRQEIKLRRGLTEEIAKRITKLIRDEYPKVKSQIQGDAVRVSGKSKDELQRVIDAAARARRAGPAAVPELPLGQDVLPGSRFARVVMIAVIVIIVLGLVLSTVAYPPRLRMTDEVPRTTDPELEDGSAQDALAEAIEDVHEPRASGGRRPATQPGRGPVGRLVADALRTAGVRYAFTVPGESFLGLLDALGDAGIRVVATRHEGGAAFMAEAHGNLTGRPAACLGTRAVGSANLAIGIHTARQDSTPMFALVGQVERAHRGHEAFQEIDQVGTIGGLAKWAAEVSDPAEAATVLREALRQAMVGRPGPVLLSLPEDVLDQDVPDDAQVPAERPRVGATLRPRHRHGHRATRRCRAARHPRGRRGAARPNVDRPAALRRAPAGADHRRVASGRCHLERPPAVPGDGRTRGCADGPGAARASRRDARHRLPPERADLRGRHHPGSRDALGARRHRARLDRRTTPARPDGGSRRAHIPARRERTPHRQGGARRCARPHAPGEQRRRTARPGSKPPRSMPVPTTGTARACIRVA